MPTLYLVATPIGNLEDISFRALRVLKEVGLIAAEDTRTTGRLLKRYGVETPLVSYHEYSGPDRTALLIEALQQKDVALVSEAGMPGLSDPGYRLVKAAIDAGVRIIPIPGPSAPITALVSSGLPTDAFLFMGFLPRQQKARRLALEEVVNLPYTLVLFEAPHRLLAALADISDILGDRPVSISRELTKLYEETWRGRVSEAIDYFSQETIRGEFTLVIGGAERTEGRWSEQAVRLALIRELASGVSRKTAAARVSSSSGWRKRELYDLALTLD